MVDKTSVIFKMAAILRPDRPDRMAALVTGWQHYLQDGSISDRMAALVTGWQP